MKKRIEKIKSNLKQRNLKYPEDMELFDDEIYLRDVKTIAQRAIATTIMAKCAFDLYDAESPDNIKKDCLARLNRFGVENCLFNAERQVLNDSYNESFDEIAWTYKWWRTDSDMNLSSSSILEHTNNPCAGRSSYDRIINHYHSLATYYFF